MSETGNEHEALGQFEVERAADIAEEKDKAFSLTGGIEEEQKALAADAPAAAPAAAAPAAAAPAQERLSSLQKINKMTVGERIKLAFLGNKEERSILIRDGSRVVYSAVLASPKLSEQEVETIASLKNVQEQVLRELARNRKFVKSMVVVKNLVNNPRCPVDISLNFIKMLSPLDLKNLSMNKNVSEMLRKMAGKAYAEKNARK
jgi:hypothetical protein